MTIHEKYSNQKCKYQETVCRGKMKVSRLFFVYMVLIIMICGCADGELSENGQKDNSSKNSVSIENRVSEIEDDTSIITATTGETVQENAKESEKEPELSDEYKIVMVGDVLLHTPVEESCRQAGGG